MKVSKLIVFYSILIVTGIVLCMFIKHYKEDVLFHNPNSSPFDCDISVFTYNIDASDSAKFTEAYQESVLDLLETVDAGVICFQELSIINHQKLKTRLDTIYLYSDLKQSDDQMWGIYFFSRYPMRNY